MFEKLILLGLACVVAAAVGGGLSFAGTTIPVLSSIRRQALVAVLGLGIIVVALLTQTPDKARARAGLPQSCETALRDGATGHTPDTAPHVLGSIDVHDRPSAIAIGRRWVWVAHDDGRVTRIDAEAPPAQQEPLPDVDVGDGFGDVALALGPHKVWMAKRESERGWLAALDTSTGKIAHIDEVAEPDDLAVGHGSVWLTDDYGMLSRLSPDPADPRAHRERIKGEPHGIWVGDGPCVYVATTQPNGFAVFDANTGRRLEGFATGAAAEVAGGAGALWLTGRSLGKDLFRVEPGKPWTGKRIALPVQPDSDALAADASGIWTADGESTVVRVDPKGDHPPAALHLGGGPVSLAISDYTGTVWVAQRDSDQITRIQP